MLDKTIKYYGVVMVKTRAPEIEVSLPEGYSLVKYKNGDEVHWADIEVSVEEFESIEESVKYFKKEYKEDIEALSERCLFVEYKGEKVGTATAWYGDHLGEKAPRIHWVGVKPEHQGKGICKYLIQAVLEVYEKHNESPVYLTTQTWSYKAINIYQQYGFTRNDIGDRNQVSGSQGSFDVNYEKAWLLIDKKIEDYN